MPLVTWGRLSLCCMERAAGEDIINLHFVFRDSDSFELSLCQETPLLLMIDFLVWAFAIFWLSQAEILEYSERLCVCSPDGLLLCIYITVCYE